MMKTSRRDFLKTSSLTIIGSAVLKYKVFSSSIKGALTGIQLYSVRDKMKINPLDTLKELSRMGYKYVEHANYADRKFYGWNAMEFKKILDDLGLKMPSGHTVMRYDHWDATKKDFTDAWKYTVEDAALCGQEFVISPSIEDKSRKNYDELLSFLNIFNKSGELCKASGMKFGYHNHQFEFKESLNGKILFDIILSETDPNLVIQQLDIGNMLNGGAHASDILKKYPGRFLSMHVKDEIKSNDPREEEYTSTILGVGVVPVKQIIDLAKQQGTKHFIIEQESYQGKSSLDCAREDLTIMKKWGY